MISHTHSPIHVVFINLSNAMHFWNDPDLCLQVKPLEPEMGFRELEGAIEGKIVVWDLWRGQPNLNRCFSVRVCCGSLIRQLSYAIVDLEASYSANQRRPFVSHRLGFLSYHRVSQQLPIGVAAQQRLRVQCRVYPKSITKYTYRLPDI